MLNNRIQFEMDGRYLGTISEDFIRFADFLRESSYRLRKAGFMYPIFPVSKSVTHIGQLLIDKEKQFCVWNYNVSHLEEFMSKGLIVSERKKDFQKIYKDPSEYCCLFVIDDSFIQFVFLPYPED